MVEWESGTGEVKLDGGAGAGPRSPKIGTGRVVPDDIWGILCIFAESRGEPYEGQVAVGNVIRNRTLRRLCSIGTVCSTVTYPYQFSWMNTGDGQRSRVLAGRWEEPEMALAAKAWFESEDHSIVGKATHYHADYVSPTWAKANGMVFINRIGRHLFYEETPR